MKLFPLVLAYASADERAFSDSLAFMQGNSNNWNKAEANKQFNDLISGTADYFSNYYPADSNRAQRAAGKLSALLTDVQNDMQRIAGKCSQTSRKRRDVAERWSVPINNPKTALNELFWVHARWAREEIYPGPKNCSKKALRIYKRLDRLKSISGWQYCDKVDNSEGFCSWAYFDNGKAKSNPRKSDWLNKNFGPDSETPFNVEACDEAWQGPTEKDITCPFGGYIQVKKAVWGRTNSQTCRGNQSAIPETCKADATEWSGDKCNGKSDCEISTNYIEAALEDPCPGVAKYIKVEWTCKDY